MTEVFRPTSLAELESTVAWALSENQALAVAGRGTKAGLGRPVEAAATLALDGLSGIAMYEPGELVMSAGAGTPLAEIEAALAEHHQELAFEPADYGLMLGGGAGAGSIGGVFSCNLAGPRRLRSGAARDHLLGVQCVTGRGEAIKSGGRVQKNVTGYDLCKLLTGSYGTLAALSQVTFKVLPAAETSATVLLLDPSVDRLLAALRRATGTSNDVSAAAVLPAGAAARSEIAAVSSAADAVGAVRLEGPAPSVRYRVEALRSTLADDVAATATLDDDASRALWREIGDVRLLPAGAPVLWRVSVAPTAASVVMAALAPLSPEILFDWAGGLIWVAVADSADGHEPAVRGAVAAVGGHATLIRGSVGLRRAIEPFQPQPPGLRALARRVKESFDPKHILNPGRMAAIP